MTVFASKNDLTRVKVGVIAQSIGQVMIGLLGIVLVKIMTTKLGSHQYGIYSTALALVSTFSLFTDLGVNTATLREIAKFPNKSKEIIGHNLGLRLTICVIVVPIVSAVGLLFYPQASHELRLAILLMSGYLIFDALWSTCIIYFSAKIRNDIVTAVMVLQQLLFLLLVALAVVTKQGLLVYILAYVFSYAVTALVAYRLTRRHIRVRPVVNLQVWQKTISLSVVLGAMGILNQVYHMADSIMLSIFKGTTQVGIYTVAYSLVGIFLFFPDYIMINLTPVIIKTEDKLELKNLVKNSYDLLACLGLFIPLISYFLGRDMVILVSNKDYTSAAVPFFILTIGVMFTYIATPFIRTCIALEKQKGLLLVTLITLVLNILINLYAIPHYGLIGAASATAISEFVSVVAIVLLFRHYVRIDVNILSALRPTLAAILTFLFIINVDKHWITTSPIHNLVIGGPVILIVYFLFLWLFKGLPIGIGQILQNIFTILLKRLHTLGRQR